MPAWQLDYPQRAPMSLNDRHHWSAKAKLTAEWVDSTIWLCRKAKVPQGLLAVTVSLTYTPVDNRRRDPLNLVQTLKAIEDGVVRAGVIPDDNPEHLVSVMPVIEKSGAPNSLGGRFVVVIEARD